MSIYTTKINIRAQEEREKREKEKHLKELEATPTGPAARPRKRKGLNFHEPGTFVSQAEQIRKKAKLQALQAKIAAAAAKTGITDAVKLASLTTNIVAEKKPDDTEPSITFEEEEIPDVEWWDKPLLKNQTLDQAISRLDAGEQPKDVLEGITRLIEHPPIKKPLESDNSLNQIPLFLTKKERQKLRRQSRKAAELEKQEKIKLGLLPKPEPKLKHSNIMYALGDEVIANPSMADQMVRQQAEKRLQAHIDHNQSKKLTVEEKRAKKLRKIQEDLSLTGTWTSVFRILDMSSKLQRKKVQLNAEQLTMTGILVIYKDINLVVVEGGPKQNRKFKHLMTERINWSEQKIDPLSNESGSVSNKCQLVWQGQIQQRSFKHFTVKTAKSDTEAREIFKKAGVENFWDLAYQSSILESIEAK